MTQQFWLGYTLGILTVFLIAIAVHVRGERKKRLAFEREIAAIDAKYPAAPEPVAFLAVIDNPFGKVRFEVCAHGVAPEHRCSECGETPNLPTATCSDCGQPAHDHLWRHSGKESVIRDGPLTNRKDVH